MSTFDDASLVMIPSGYKTSKVYSVKPTDGSGDLSFSRSNDTATRVNSAGLIEKVRTNRVLQSNSFNTTWISLTTTLTSGQADPNGGTSGWRFLTTSAGGYIYQNSVLQNGVEMTASVWVKSNTGSSQTFRFTANSGGQQSGVITATTSWQRVSWTFTSSGAGEILFGYNASTTLDLLIYGFQVETGVMTDYIATTTAAVSVGPVANVPRLDYLNSSCPRLLLEPQRTNDLTFSEQFDNAGWSKLNATITANNIVSPDGYTNADRITDDAVNASHAVYRTGWDTTQRTASVYAKAGTSSKVYIINGSTATGVFADLSTGTITATGTFTGTITNVGNGWYRITATDTAASSETFAIGLFTGTSTTVYVGTGSYAYIWGAQLEAGAYATSYIPTLGSASTRAADAAYKTGISSLIGQTEGTALLDFQFNGATESIIMDISASGLSPQNRIILYQPSGGIVQFIILNNDVAQVNLASSSYSIGQRLKVAIAYKANDFAFYINGVQIGTDNSGSVPATSRIDIGNRQDAAFPATISVNQALLFKTRLTNAELAQLTAL